MRIALAYVAIALSALLTPAAAQDLDHGRQLAERWCAECHAVGSKPTRFRRATPFVAIAAKDSVTMDTLTTFLLLPHATMLNVQLSRQDAVDLAAFIISMKK